VFILQLRLFFVNMLISKSVKSKSLTVNN